MSRKIQLNTKSSWSQEDGMVLMASTLAIFVVLTLLATTVIFLMVNARDEAANIVVESKARHIAETGLDQGIQQYRRTRVPPHFTDIPFGTGKYTVRYEAGTDETGAALSWPNYVMIKSMGKVYDVERNIRIFLNSLPWAFHFALYSQNLNEKILYLTESTVNGSVYYRGNVDTTVPVSETVYTPPGFTATTGVVTYHPEPQPPFPYIDKSSFQTLLATASNSASGDLVIQNSTLNLTDYADNTIYVNGPVQFQNSTVVGPGRIIAMESVVVDNSTLGDGIMIVSDDQIQVSQFSNVGTGVSNPNNDGVILFSEGQIQIQNSTFYGLLISAGPVESQLQIQDSELHGAFLCSGKLDASKSTIVGSLVVKGECVIAECTIVRGPLPLVESQDIGLEPYIIPGTWLEY